MSLNTDGDNGDNGDIRKKIIEFIKNEGYQYTEGDQEFDDETNDLFGKDGTLIEISITIGIDNEVMKQIVFIRKWNGKFVIPIPAMQVI